MCSKLVLTWNTLAKNYHHHTPVCCASLNFVVWAWNNNIIKIFTLTNIWCTFSSLQQKIFMMRKLLSKYGIQSSVAKELRMVTIDHRWYFSRFAPNKSYKIMFLIHSGLEDFVAYNSWRRFIVTNSLCCILTTKLIPIKVVRKAKLTSLHQINNLHSWLTSHHGHPKTPEWQWTAPK